MHTIIKESGYLLVSLEGEATYQDIKNAIAEELARDDYQSMNDVWDFTNCILLISHDQLDKVVNEVMLRYPKTYSRTKTAIVTPSGFSEAMGVFWMDQAYLLPYAVKVFTRMQDAEEWLA